MFKARSLASSFVFVCLSGTALAGVIVVDDNGVADFNAIQDAVNAAMAGDTILVKAGNYDWFTIDDKTLTIVAETSAVVAIDGPIEVRNLALSKTVVLTGLRSQGWNGSSNVPSKSGLYLWQNAGAVRLQDCTFQGGAGINTGPPCMCAAPGAGPCSGFTGALVRSNPGGVAFVKCSMFGGLSLGVETCDCGNPVVNGGPGLEVVDGLVALYDCIVRGGQAGNSCPNGGTGGPGCTLVTNGPLTGLVSSGTTIVGGGGGMGSGQDGDGGAGLDAGPGTVVWLLDTSPQGGGGAGQPGQAITGSGQIFVFSQPKIRFEVPSPVRELQTVTLVVRGRPGDEVRMFKALHSPFLPMAMWHGVVLARNPESMRQLDLGKRFGLPATPQAYTILGIIPASGVLTLNYQFGDLGPFTTEQTWFLQAWRDSPIDGLTVGSMRAVTVLDSSY